MTISVVANSSYTHDPTPSVVISFEPTFDNAGVKLGVRQKWSITGVLLGPSIDSKVSSLKSIYAGTLLSKIELKRDAAVLESIEQINFGANDADKLESVLKFPEGSGVELATKREYSIEVLSALNAEISSSLHDDYTITLSTNKIGVISYTYSGSVTTPIGTSAALAVGTLKTTFTLPTNFFIDVDDLTFNGDDTEASFTLIHKSLPPNSANAAYPASVKEASVSTDVSYDDQNIKKTTISGYFVGSSGLCDTNITLVELGAGNILINKSDSRDDYDSKTSFSRTYISHAAADEIESHSAVTIGGGIPEFVIKPVIDSAPIQQIVGTSAFFARESGSITKVGSYPTATVPRAAWSTYLKSKNITQVTPRINGPGGAALYEVTWDYSYVSPATLAFTD